MARARERRRAVETLATVSVRVKMQTQFCTVTRMVLAGNAAQLLLLVGQQTKCVHHHTNEYRNCSASALLLAGNFRIRHFEFPSARNAAESTSLARDGCRRRGLQLSEDRDRCCSSVCRCCMYILCILETRRNFWSIVCNVLAGPMLAGQAWRYPQSS